MTTTSEPTYMSQFTAAAHDVREAIALLNRAATAVNGWDDEIFEAIDGAIVALEAKVEDLDRTGFEFEQMQAEDEAADAEMERRFQATLALSADLSSDDDILEDDLEDEEVDEGFDVEDDDL